MILQALKDYYDRKSIDPDGGVAPEGFEYKEIPFVIVLDSQGYLVQIEDHRYQNGKQLRAKAFLVPQSEIRSSGVKAYLLWDNAEYIFGISLKNKPERVMQQHEAFVNRIVQLGVEDDVGVNAVLKFLLDSPMVALERSNHAIEIKEANPFMAFRLNSDNGLVCERERVIEKIVSLPGAGSKGVCLITGAVDSLAKLHPPIKGVRGAKSTGAPLVSFNLDSCNSFNKQQGANAQVGKKSVFAYTTALNHLLRKDSTQKIQIGDTSTVLFWSEKKSHFENEFSSLFDEPPKDNPDQLTDSVKALFRSVETGSLPIDDNQTRFFVLGLSPNAARIAVRFWHVGTVDEFSQTIIQHFRDLELVHSSKEKEYLSLLTLLRSVSMQGDLKNISPNIAGEWMRCILTGLPYPESLFQAALRRVHAEREVNYARAAIIKGCLNRSARFHNKIEKEITMSLDEDNINLGYRLGRLFAALEKIQEEANSGINATIRDRYYSTASSTPANVMPILMRLKNHHLAKLVKGRSVYFERLIGEVISKIANFPSQLNLQDQGRFAVGYYHQRQAFFTKSKNLNQGE